MHSNAPRQLTDDFRTRDGTPDQLGEIAATDLLRRAATRERGKDDVPEVAVVGSRDRGDVRQPDIAVTDLDLGGVRQSDHDSRCSSGNEDDARHSLTPQLVRETHELVGRLDDLRIRGIGSLDHEEVDHFLIELDGRTLK